MTNIKVRLHENWLHVPIEARGNELNHLNLSCASDFKSFIIYQVFLSISGTSTTFGFKISGIHISILCEQFVYTYGVYQF